MKKAAAAMAGLACAVLAGLAACSAVSPHLRRTAASASGASAPGVTRVAQQLSVTTPQGNTLDTGQKVQVLQGVAAQGNAEAIKRHLHAMARFGEVGLYAANEARLLIDGPATFKAMFEAIGRARHTVLLESYIIEDAAVSRRLAALLASKRAQGVQVFVIYDAVGSIGTQDSFFTALQEAGIAICAFNPVNPLKRKAGDPEIEQRDHRKILTVDRETGFTGGINFSAVYASGSFGRRRSSPAAPAPAKPSSSAAPAATEGWRDTQIQLRGPAAGALDDLVREAWQAQACEGALPPPPAPRAERVAAPQLLRIVPSGPDDAQNPIYALLMGAIEAAQTSIRLTMAYFAPGQEMVDALCAAAQRGVDVQLILPSRSDFSPVLHAGRSHYQRLLAAGVRIYELQDAVLHAKTAVIDGVVSSVGSANMDSRSFSTNREINAVVIGEDFGDAMARMFRQDLAASREITRSDWASRSLWQRGKEFFARLFEGLW